MLGGIISCVNYRSFESADSYGLEGTFSLPLDHATCRQFQGHRVANAACELLALLEI
jgi:hypothetical protein